MKNSEFQEIGHCGGKLTIHAITDPSGQRLYQLGVHHQGRGTAAGFFAIYALLPHGIPVAYVPLGGIGSRMPPPPTPNCVLVFIGSDSQGLYGHECPLCHGYWRDQMGVNLFCVYCGFDGKAHEFLTTAQRRYVVQFCERYLEALNAEQDGDFVIDMDAVADAANVAGDKPPFYYAEQSQQNSYKCQECGSINDVLGRFAYCSTCGTRNELQELTTKMMPDIRDRVNNGDAPERCAQDCVAAFDTIAGQLVEQLTKRVLMTEERRNRLRKRFHNLEVVVQDLRDIFDINILQNVQSEDLKFAKLLFFRRHVYEHRGGEADEKYIKESGDSVKPKQVLHESRESVHRLATIVQKLVGNLHSGFHAIIPQNKAPIEQNKRYSAPTNG